MSALRRNAVRDALRLAPLERGNDANSVHDASLIYLMRLVATNHEKEYPQLSKDMFLENFLLPFP
jgi:hypothetical protein